jgi:hypothetical protein
VLEVCREANNVRPGVELMMVMIADGAIPLDVARRLTSFLAAATVPA